MKLNQYTWKDLEDMAPGTIIYKRKLRRDYLGLILRGPFSICGYVGVPKENILTSFIRTETKKSSLGNSEKPLEYTMDNYWEVYDLLQEINGDDAGVPHGFTFGGFMPPVSEHYFFGWDHGHCEDRMLYPDKRSKIQSTLIKNRIAKELKYTPPKERMWYPFMVRREVLDIAEQLRKVEDYMEKAPIQGA